MTVDVSAYLPADDPAEQAGAVLDQSSLRWDAELGDGLIAPYARLTSGLDEQATHLTFLTSSGRDASSVWHCATRPVRMAGHRQYRVLLLAGQEREVSEGLVHHVSPAVRDAQDLRLPTTPHGGEGLGPQSALPVPDPETAPPVLALEALAAAKFVRGLFSLTQEELQQVTGITPAAQMRWAREGASVPRHPGVPVLIRLWAAAEEARAAIGDAALRMLVNGGARSLRARLLEGPVEAELVADELGAAAVARRRQDLEDRLNPLALDAARRAQIGMAGQFAANEAAFRAARSGSFPGPVQEAGPDSTP